MFELIYQLFKLPFIILGFMIRISFIIVFWPFILLAWILKIVFALAIFDWLIGLLFPIRCRYY